MFSDDRLRGLGVARGQILAFCIDFDCRPYNTLALPYECVIGQYAFHRAIYEPCALPITWPRGWLKTGIFTFGVAFYIFVAGDRKHFDLHAN